MSELTWSRLSLLNVEAIDDATAYWSAYLRRLTETADAIDTDVRNIIDEESFDSQTGEGCRSQLRAIASEIHDHVGEAGDPIKALLADAYESLSDHKTSMQRLLDEAVDARLRISDDGEVYLSEVRMAEIEAWAGQQGEADGSGNAAKYVQEEVARVEQTECQPLTEQIRRLVESARGYDDAVTARLTSIRNAYVEMPPPLGSGWHEQVAQYWVNRAVHLFNGGEDQVLSGEELDEFNQIVAERGDNPVFATMLMNQLGPEGLVMGLHEVVWDLHGDSVYGDPAASTLTADQVNRMYEVLGVALATATDPTNEVHVDDEWIAQLMNLGGTEVSAGNTSWYGYQLLAPALPHGRYHEDFLVPVTEHMLAIDAAEGWPKEWTVAGIGPDGGYGENPVNWALVALDHNPHTALNLFTGGGTGLDDIDGVNLHRVEPVDDPFAYLMDRADRYGIHQATINPDLLGNALESAATGVSTNPTYAPDTPPVHSDRMAALADRLIDHVTANPDEFTAGPKSQMVDNFGAITVAYIDDFHQAMASPDIGNWAVDQPGADLALGSPGDANQRLASDWLRIIGYDQAATAEVWGASEGLMFNQLEAAVAHGDQDLGTANQAFEMHGRFTAALTVGALDAIADGEYQRAADHNQVINLFTQGATSGAAIVTGLTTGNPWVGAGMGVITSYGIDYVADFAKISDEEAQAKIAGQAQDQLNLSEETMRNSDTLAHVEHILRTKSNLTEREILTALGDYYETYSDRVYHYARRFTG